MAGSLRRNAVWQLLQTVGGTGTELLIVGTRAGVARNANAEWGDVVRDDEHGQVVVMDDTGERFNLEAQSLTEIEVAEEARAAERAAEEAERAVTYVMRDESGDTELDATTLAEARKEARQILRDGDWDVSQGTIWVDAHIVHRDEVVDTVTVALDPPEPDCVESEHKWKDTGMRGNGGGLLYAETCEHCGCVKRTDTWAQRSDTGQQGLRSVSYEEAS
mgnify:FL=1